MGVSGSHEWRVQASLAELIAHNEATYEERYAPLDGRDDVGDGNVCHICQHVGATLPKNGLWYCDDFAACNQRARRRLGISENRTRRLYREESGGGYRSGWLPANEACHRCGVDVHHFRGKKQEYWLDCRPVGNLLITRRGDVLEAREPLPSGAGSYQIHARSCRELRGVA